MVSALRLFITYHYHYRTGDSSEKYKLKLSVIGVNSQDDGMYICHVQLGDNYLESKRVLQSSKSIVFPKRK